MGWCLPEKGGAMRVAFIGFGEAARAFRESLAATDPALGFAAYDILVDS